MYYAKPEIHHPHVLQHSKKMEASLPDAKQRALPLSMKAIE